MTQPALARDHNKGRHYDIPVDGGSVQLPSVTNVISVLNKPALPRWAAKSVAEWVAENVEDVRGLIAKDKAAAIEAMKGAPWRQMNTARDLGTYVHAIAESHVLGRPLPSDIPAEAAPTLQGFLGFLHDHEPEYLATEMTVASLTHGYAGTLDAIMTIRGRTLIVDYKSGKGVYPEAALQLAGLRFADFGVLPNGERVEIPEIAGGAVLHLRPEGYKLIPVRCDAAVFAAFLGCLKLWRWQTDDSPSVLGVPAAVNAQAQLEIVK